MNIYMDYVIDTDFLNEFAEKQGLTRIDEPIELYPTSRAMAEILEIAKTDVLDERVMQFASGFDNLSDFDGFYYEVLPLADFQRKKTGFATIMKKIRNQVEGKERIERRNEKQQSLPDWIYLDKYEKPKVNEDVYITRFLECYPLKYINGIFYDYTGEKKDSDIATLIQEDKIIGIRNYIFSGLARITNNLLNALKNAVNSGEIIPDMKQIHFSNGILSADENGLFTIWSSGAKEIYVNNLECTYNQNAKEPTKFLAFLHELLVDDDIHTLQQWLGHLLLPTNKLQKSLYLQGEGGEGKSVIGNIIKCLFGGRNFFSSGIEHFDQSRFASSNLENKLFFLDDDVRNGALKNSGIFKTIISSNGKAYVERKGMQEHEINLYARFLLFGNYPLLSLYDTSNGFYRRFHYIKVKPKAKSRKDILAIEETFLDREKEGITKWLVDGLNELIKSEWNWYISARSTEVSNELKFQNDTIRLFLNSGEDKDSNIVFGKECKCPITTLYDTYCDFCRENGFEPVSQNGFSSRIYSVVDEYNLKQSTNVPTCDKNGKYKRVRGLLGIGIKVISVPNSNYENNTIS